MRPGLIDTFYNQIKVLTAGTDFHKLLWFRDTEMNGWQSKIQRNRGKRRNVGKEWVFLGNICFLLN